MPDGIGIDLGTSTSEIARFDPAISPTARLVSIGGSNITPSVVWFDEARREVVVGREALIHQVEFPDRIISSVKIQMGRSTSELRDPLRGDPRLPFKFEGREYGPVEIAAEILRFLAEGARARGTSVDSVVVTVPAGFDLRQKEATVRAVQAAGLTLLMLLPEPTAALLAYDGLAMAAGQTVLVYDLGGGTLDCTIIRTSNTDRSVSVLAKTGQIGIAGNRVDELLFQETLHRLQRDRGVDLAQEMGNPDVKRSRQALITQCCLVKERLSEASTTVLDAPNLRTADGVQFDFQTEFTRDEFEKLIARLVLATRTHVEQALRQASLRPNDIHQVLLVGGSSRIPRVRRMVEELFGSQKVRWDLPPELAVPQGAAIAAFACLQDQRFFNDTLTYTLGTRDASSLTFRPLIPRGISLQRAVATEHGTWPSGETAVAVELYEALDLSWDGAQPQDVEELLPQPDGRRKCLPVGTWRLDVPIPPLTDQPFSYTVHYNRETSLAELTAAAAWAEVKVHLLSSDSSDDLSRARSNDRPRLDIIYVLDTSGSMRHSSHWKGLRKLLEDVPELLEQAGADYRIAITTFGDLRGGDAISSQELTTRKEEFFGYMNRLEDWKTEGGDESEACWDALAHAGRATLRSGPGTLRAFVLITDSSTPADPVSSSAEQVLADLRRQGIVLYCISPDAREYAEMSQGALWRNIDDGEMGRHLTDVLEHVAAKMTARVG